MFYTATADATASTAPAADIPLPPTPTAPREYIRHLLFGTPATVQATIRQLHQLGYAEPNDWSRPIPTGNPGEVMATLVKRVISQA
ncbi:MAG: hypothetical protein AAF716_09945 [Cyanobacteria bacterium P01_D01_bin.1]